MGAKQDTGYTPGDVVREVSGRIIQHEADQRSNMPSVARFAGSVLGRGLDFITSAEQAFDNSRDHLEDQALKVLSSTASRAGSLAIGAKEALFGRVA